MVTLQLLVIKLALLISQLNTTISKNYSASGDREIWTVGATADIAKNVSLVAEYLKSNDENAAGDDDGYVAGLSYKAHPLLTKVLMVFGLNTMINPALLILGLPIQLMQPMEKLDENGGFKGLGAGVNYTLAKISLVS